MPQIPLPQAAVGAYVLHNGKVLLVQRGNPPGQGQWAIPGGRIRPGEDLQAACEREVLEETGIVVRALSPVHAFDYIEYDSQDRLLFHYVIVDLSAEYVGGVPVARDDAAASGFFAPQELAHMTLNPATEAFLKKMGFLVTRP